MSRARAVRWVICSTCDGHGAHSRDFGAITADEWNGPDWDEDSREAYLEGRYDEPCARCNGSGKVDANAPKPERDEAWESERWLRYAESGAMQ